MGRTSTVVSARSLALIRTLPTTKLRLSVTEIGWEYQRSALLIPNG